MKAKNYNGWCFWKPIGGFKDTANLFMTSESDARWIACEALYDPETEYKKPNKTWKRLTKAGGRLFKVRFEIVD